GGWGGARLGGGGGGEGGRGVGPGLGGGDRQEEYGEDRHDGRTDRSHTGCSHATLTDARGCSPVPRTDASHLRRFCRRTFAMLQSKCDRPATKDPAHQLLRKVLQNYNPRLRTHLACKTRPKSARP